MIVPPLVKEGNNLADNAPEYAQDVTEFVNENKQLREINEDYDLTRSSRRRPEKLPAKLGGAAVHPARRGRRRSSTRSSRWSRSSSSPRSCSAAARRGSPRAEVRARGPRGASRAGPGELGAGRGQLRGGRARAGDARGGHVLRRAEDPRSAVRGAARRDHLLPRPYSADRRHDRRRNRGAVHRLRRTSRPPRSSGSSGRSSTSSSRTTSSSRRSRSGR